MNNISEPPIASTWKERAIEQFDNIRHVAALIITGSGGEKNRNAEAIIALCAEAMGAAPLGQPDGEQTAAVAVPTTQNKEDCRRCFEEIVLPRLANFNSHYKDGAWIGFQAAWETKPSRYSDHSEDTLDMVRATGYRMPDGRPIFGEGSPHAIGQHLDALCPSEFSDTDLVNKLSSRISAWRSSGIQRSTHAEALDYVEFVSSHLRSPEPVMVSLDKCAKAAWDATPYHCEVSWPEAKKLPFMEGSYKECVRQTKAVLDAAGVKYVD